MKDNRETAHQNIQTLVHPPIQEQESQQNPNIGPVNDLEQVPGMREVLLNSLRINKKLHGEIVAKEYSVKSEAHQVNLKLQTLYRDMEEIYIKTQQLYEETVRQNQKTRFMAEELLKPFRQELKGKVDETTLSLKMKMMLSEFDNLGHKISYDKQGKVLQTDDNHTFRFIRTELLPLISSIEHQLHQNTLITDRHGSQLSTLYSRQDDLTQQMIKQRQRAFEMQNGLVDQINSKINDEVWDYRLNNFYNAYIRTHINSIVSTIATHHKEAQMELTQVKNELKTIKSNNFQTRLTEYNKKIEGIRQDLAKLNRESMSQFLSEWRKKIEDNQTALQIQISKSSPCSNHSQVDLLIEQSKSVNAKLDSFSSALRSQVEKAMISADKGLISKVSKLESDIKIIYQNMKSTHKILQNDQSQIGFIKDVLSQKANFSDVISQVENKADKQDYKELKHLLEANTNIEHLEEEHCMITQEEVGRQVTPNRFRKRQSPGSRKNYQQSVSPFCQSERDDSVKRYMLGLRNGVGSFTRENLSKEKSKFTFMNQAQRRKSKNISKGQTFSESFI